MRDASGVRFCFFSFCCLPSFPLPFFFLVVLVHVSCLYSFFPFGLLLLCFVLYFLACSSVAVQKMSCVLHMFSMFFLARHCPHLSPQQYLAFWRSFDFRSFILSDSLLCYQICLLYKLIYPFFKFIFIFILFLFHLTHTDHHVY